MQWFLAKLIFSLDIQPTTSTLNQFDEQLRLIKEETRDMAVLKARHLGKKMQTKIETSQGRTIAWNFVDVKEIIQLGDLTDGMELYSTTFESSNRDEYVKAVMMRSLYLSDSLPQMV